jgi:hypothetical protein
MTTIQIATNTGTGPATHWQPDSDLGLALLVAEDEDGRYEPVAAVGTITEAQEIADCDLRARMRRLERGDDPGLRPAVYKLWARGIDGAYSIAMEIVHSIRPAEPVPATYE